MGNRLSYLAHKKHSKHMLSSEVNSTVASFQDMSVSSNSQPKFQTNGELRQDTEVTREQNGHFLLMHLLQRAYMAPIDDVLSKPETLVLDVGSGPMAPWIVEMANDFPNTTFYALDLRDFIVNTMPIVPENCRFVKGNILDGIDQPDNHFDYVHQRLMYSVFQGDEASTIMLELFRITKPKGWVELLEYDFKPKRAGPLFGKIMESVMNILRHQQNIVFCGPKLHQFLHDAGFKNIKTDYVSAPLCWGGQVGRLMYQNALKSLRSLGPILYHQVGLAGDYNAEIFDEFLDNAFDECVERQTFVNVHWACGQKPESL